jgi:hypothetical protein
MIWIGTATQGGVLETDVFTDALSHELAETISDPDSSGIQVTPPSGLPSSLKGDNQIGDNEPAAAGQYHYGYRLNGVWVQPYWSRQDNSFIVPDDNTQKFFLSPIWNGTTFSGTYNLSVQGDQFGGNSNDAITIDKSAVTGGVQVGLNGQSVTFDRGLINTVNVDTGGGSNRVSVAALPPSVALFVSSSGASTDSVYVGSGGSLAAIQGTVNVSNSSGQTALYVNASNDGARSVTLTDHSVTFWGLTTINYQGGFVGYVGGLHGVTSLSVTDSNAANLVYVASVPALTNVSLSASLWDYIYGPAVTSVSVHRRFQYIIYYYG